jgi:endonuclease-3
MTAKKESKRASKILKTLEKEYPEAHIALEFSDPLELLVATVLSAQSTDAQINKITPKLFKKYPTVYDYARAKPGEFEKDIYSSGFYKNKTKNIIAAAQKIVKDYHGKVPDSMDELVKIPGIGRKTANIILSNAFGIVVGIAVDTHVGRLSQRMGFTKNEDPNKIERDLMELFPKDQWYKINYLLIDHGRAVCNAKKPLCDKCCVAKLCPSAGKFG